MKLNVRETVEVLKGSESADTVFGIDGKNMHLAIQAFYQYSNPIGSIVREITSNAYDAHIEADQDKPIIIQINERDNQLHVLDFGIGMSPERVKDVYTRFFSSTKRETNTQIGAFGLGSKSPMSYSDMFQVITKYGNTVYDYIVHKSDGIPNLINVESYEYSEDDDWPWKADENGTEVIIPFKSEDMHQLKISVTKQLAYFDNVLVAHDEFDSYNKEKIYRDKRIIYRPVGNGEFAFSHMHICIGKVYYPINDGILGFFKTYFPEPDKQLAPIILDAFNNVYGNSANIKESNIAQRFYDKYNLNYNTSYYRSTVSLKRFLEYANDIPVGVYFDIGELPILWHRENIEYTKEAQTLLAQRIFEVLFQIEKHQEVKLQGLTSLEKAMHMDIRDDSNIYFNNAAINATQFEVKIPALAHMKNKYGFNMDIAKPSNFVSRLYSDHSDSEKTTYASTIFEGETIYYIDEDERRKDYLKAYMGSKHPKDLRFIQIKKDPFGDIENLEDADRQIIENYAKQFYEYIEDNLIEANEVTIPEEFIKNPPAQTTASIPILWRRLSGYGGDVKYNRSDLKPALDGRRVSWRDISFVPTLLVYGFREDRKKINQVSRLSQIQSLDRREFGLGSPHSIVGAVISKDTASYIHDLLPAIHVDDLLHHRRLLSTPITCYLINRYFKNNLWFTQVYKLVNNESWRRIHKIGLISDEEYVKVNKIKWIDNPFQPNTEKYLQYGLKRGYYHQDEIDHIKWVHGMYRKFYLLLTTSSHTFKEEYGNYLDDLLRQTPLNINPILLRTKHVRNKT